MRNKIVSIITLCLIFICMIGFVPQFLYNHNDTSHSDEINIEWEKLYPFTYGEKNIDSENGLTGELSRYVTDNPFETYRVIFQKVEHKVEDVFNNNFLFRIPIVELNGRILRLTGIKQIRGSDTIVDLGDGYLTLTQKEKDISEAAKEVNEFSLWLEERDIDFLYVQAPFKIEEDSSELAGYVDFSNANADNFIQALEGTVNTLDLREELKKDFSGNYKEQFFKTDHHWLPETGLWAAQKISEQLNEKYGYEIQTDVFDIDNFNVETYEEWLLGSLGKKVTLGYTNAEDLNIYYPKYETQLSVNVKSLDVDVEGDFYSTLIYQRVLQERNYYDWDAYWAYGYGDRALIEIDNLNINSGKKILMIKDSFADTVYPFLSLGVDEIDIIDMRHFTGSLKEYIDESNPNMVIFLCNPSSLPDGEVPRDGHINVFDLQ